MGREKLMTEQQKRGTCGFCGQTTDLIKHEGEMMIRPHKRTPSGRLDHRCACSGAGRPPLEVAAAASTDVKLARVITLLEETTNTCDVVYYLRRALGVLPPHIGRAILAKKEK